MPVQIEAILALLPEMFPGVQAIPLANIRPNPENPGPPLTDQAVQELADNLADRGLVNPIKVQPDKADPLVGGVKPHPDNPRLAVSAVEPITLEGRPWALSDFNFQILAGERRWRAAGRLKWATLQGFILTPTAEEAVEITHLDNDVRERGWWAGYQSIEQLVKANPSLTQRQVATRLKMDLPKVNRALGLLPLLNAVARGLIVRNSNNSNKGIKGISEAAALRLADLGPDRGLKPGVKAAGAESQKLWPYPAIPPETQDLVRRALEVAIDQELTEAGVKGLVSWVQDGGNPAEYGKKSQKPEAPTPHGVGARDDSQMEDEEEESEEDLKPIPWSEASNHPEYREVPVARVRVNRFIANLYSRHRNTGRRVASMKANGYAGDIRVRSLSDEEKGADPEHDYELFDEPLTLWGAQALGWTNLRALIYAIDEREGVRLHNLSVDHSTPLTWTEKYGWIEARLAEGSERTAAEWAILMEEDPALVERVLPVLKLLNDSARQAITQSVHRCYEGRMDMGGYRFCPDFALLLEPLKGFSKDLSKTQELVEKVVRTAIENELYEDEIGELVDWALDGNDPGKFKAEALAE